MSEDLEAIVLAEKILSNPHDKDSDLSILSRQLLLSQKALVKIGKANLEQFAALEGHPVIQLQEAQALCAKQAKDDGLWFKAETAPEGYLQQELRRLHAIIEGDERAKAALKEDKSLPLNK